MEKRRNDLGGDVLLINPKISEYSQNRKINALINISFPTSIGVLAGYLMASGIERVHIIDEQLDPLSDEALHELIFSLREPRIIGLSVLTLNSGRAFELAAKIKALDQASSVIFGGIHPTVVPEQVLCRPGVDIVVRGEGEETFKELVSLILDGKDILRVAGISYRNNGGIVHNSDRPLIGNLDQIPPFPYHLFEKNLDRYPNFSGVFGSRGCPYGCTFCSARSISGRKYRFHSVERVISECAILIDRYKQESVFLMDDNISVDKKHFIELCDAIIREGLHEKAFFHGSMRGDNATDEILDKAIQANFRIIYYGLETGSERLMKVINKGETVREVAEAIERAAGKGIAVGTTIIFGLPTETRKDRWDAIRFVKSLPLSSVRFNTLAPYPGTPVYKMLEPQGKILVKGDWANFGVQYMWESDDIPYVPDGNDRLELIFDTMYANLSYYLSFTGIKRLFTSRYAAGNVVKLRRRWYFSLGEINKMVVLFFYLFPRFLNVTARMLWGMFRKKLRK
jgi:anaerobic magnesium-protoporphyrin IX monomethyl ester cyclase